MAGIWLHTRAWRIVDVVPSRRSRRPPQAAADTLPDLPAEFLNEQTSIAESVVVTSETSARRGAGTEEALDLSCDLAEGEAALCGIRHPWGALPFHRSIAWGRRGARASFEHRFSVTIRSADPST